MESEETPNFIISSQNSDLNEEQLDEIELKAQAKNTKKATEWGVRKFEKIIVKLSSFVLFHVTYGSL